MEDFSLALLQGVGGFGDFFHLLFGGEPSSRRYSDTGGDTALETSHAHHEEFVQVAGDDREEVEAL